MTLFHAMIFTVLIATVSGSSPARAEGECRQDSQKFCAKSPDFSQRLKCLVAHQAEISAPCRETVSRMQSRGQEFAKDCGANAAKYCSGLDGREAWKCLFNHFDILSPDCKNMLESMQQSRHEFHETIPASCVSFAQTQCKGVLSGKITECLMSHKNQLSSECRHALSEPLASAQENKTP